MAIKRGNEVNIKTGGGVKMKDVRIDLKGGQSIKVVVCSTQDYVEVPSHNDFSHKIYPQACMETDCPLCAVAELGDEFKGLKVKNRYKFAFAAVEADKIMVLELTSGQAKKLKNAITGEYKEDIEFGAVFNLKREGDGKETSYTLNLISERKMTAKDKEAVEKYKGYEISDDFFEDVCKPMSKGFIYKALVENTTLDIPAMFADAEKLLAEIEEKDGTNATANDITNDQAGEDFNP